MNFRVASASCALIIAFTIARSVSPISPILSASPTHLENEVHIAVESTATIQDQTADVQAETRSDQPGTIEIVDVAAPIETLSETRPIDTNAFAKTDVDFATRTDDINAIPVTLVAAESSAIKVSTNTAKPGPAVEHEPKSTMAPEMERLQSKIQTALNIYRPRMLDTASNGQWSIMHSLIAFGIEQNVLIGGSPNKTANAIGWICFNGPCRGSQLFYLSNGQIHVRQGPGFEGHAGQFMAMLAQSKVRKDYPMRIGGRKFTVADLIEREKETCYTGTELTFKLIGLSHYLEPGATWTNEVGQKWTIDRLVKEEISHPIIGAACGGTHRLFGLSYALNRRQKHGLPIDGQFKRAETYLNDYYDYTFKLQNRDGSFSTAFFKGRGASMDTKLRLESTGHITEWLSFSLTVDELKQPRMVKAVNYLSGLLISGKHRDWPVGPLGHALHALNIYDGRVFGDVSAQRKVEEVAKAKI